MSRLRGVAMTSLLCVSSHALRAAAPPLARLRLAPGAAPMPTLCRAIRSVGGGRGRRGWARWRDGRGGNCNGRPCVAALSTTSDDSAELDLDHLNLEIDRPADGEGSVEDALVGWAGAGGDKGRVVEPGSIYFVATPIGRRRAHTRADSQPPPARPPPLRDACEVAPTSTNIHARAQGTSTT